jgi:hypothetical protein
VPLSAKQTSKYLLVGSTKAYSGKSSIVLGMAQQFQLRGLDIAYGKPLGTCVSASQADGIDEDVRFLGKTLNLPPNRLGQTLLFLEPETLEKRLQGFDRTDYKPLLAESLENLGGELIILEAGATLESGRLFDLSVPQMAQQIDASVLLVDRFHSLTEVGELVGVKQRLGDRLLGVVLTDIPPESMSATETLARPFLEERGIPVFGMMPRSQLLRSVSVGELASRLNAEVLCRGDRLDLMVESLKIGAMNVNSALKYFSEGQNMAVVTGGDRTEIQLAALETSTQCLILTGHLPPSPLIISRAEEVEVPVLSVDLDTLTTVEAVEDALGHVRLQEPIKVEYMRKLMSQHFQIESAISALGLETAVTTP